MRLKSFGVAICFVATGLLIAAAPANAAISHPATPHASRTLDYSATASSTAVLESDAPQAAKDEIARIKRAGGTILAIAHSDYHLASNAASAKPSMASFPSGCGLYVYVYKDGDYIVNSSLTSCLFSATAMEMYGGIGRSRFLGEWETMETDESYNEGHGSLTLLFHYYCRGTGTHDFQAVTNGELISNGTTYTAAAYDIIKNVHC